MSRNLRHVRRNPSNNRLSTDRTGQKVHRQALTNDRTRFPNTYIGTHVNQQAAWTAPTTRSVRLTPAERTRPLAKNAAPYAMTFVKNSVRAMMCEAFAPCVSIKYAVRVELDTTVLRYVILLCRWTGKEEEESQMSCTW